MTYTELRWAPPVQANPTVVSVPTTFYSGSFGASEDVIFNWPASNRTSSFTCTGGRHVRIIGGASAQTGNGSGLTFAGVSGSVFVEGIAADLSIVNVDWMNAYGQAIPGPYSLYPDVYIQNCNVAGVNGTMETTHADVFQAQGSIGTLHIDKCTFSTNYQGISILQGQSPITAAYISRTNLWYGFDDSPATTCAIWNQDPAYSLAWAPVYLDEVFVTPRYNQSLASSIQPAPGTLDASGTAIGMLTDDDYQTAYWPAAANVSGYVSVGPPLGGDFCPVGVPGPSYVSPGYQS